MPEIDIRQQVMERGYWIAIPSDVLRRIVEVLVEQAEGEVGEYAAVADLLLHADRGITKSVRDWAKRWKWDRGKVHRFLQKKRDRSVTEARQKRDRSVTKNGKSVEESAKAETASRQKRDRSVTASRQPIYIDRASSYSEEEEEGERDESVSARARPSQEVFGSPAEEINPNDPQVRPPTETEVRDWARGVGGVPPDTAWEIAESYMATGWVTNKGVAVRNWKSAIRTAYTYRQKSGADRGSNRQAATDYQRRRDFGNRPLREQDYKNFAASLPDVKRRN